MSDSENVESWEERGAKDAQSRAFDRWQQMLKDYDAPPIGPAVDEAIMKDGQAVGYVSSGGYAHHVGKSVALGYVPTGLVTAGTRVEVEIMGQLYAAEILEKPLYDADGGRMRS